MPNEKILLVDDEESNLRLLIQWLIPLGYDIELASNGEEAVHKARNSRPDLIILDIMMPVMDGYEACRLIKEEPETKNIPIIMATALFDRESKLKGLSVSANDFLSNPGIQMAAAIALNHHERWDGGGYPGGRKGEEIPENGREKNRNKISGIRREHHRHRARTPNRPGSGFKGGLCQPFIL
jgi:response regulator RpfG family c-di-GMP phosphodiesterase